MSLMTSRVFLPILARVLSIVLVLVQQKEKSVDCLQIKEGQLSVRYLGVPLITSKMSVADYSVLIDKISRKIDSCLAKKISLLGGFS